MTRPQLKHDRLEQQRRRRGVERALLRGHSNLTDLAAAHGVTPSCISHDIKAIQKAWSAGQYMTAESEERAAAMVARLDYVIAEAWNDYEISKKKLCLHCKAGMVRTKDGTLEDCHRCAGEGVVVVPGDSAYLNTIRATLVEIARITGVYPGVASKLSREIIQQQLPDGTIKQTITEQYAQIPLDIIMRAKGACDDYRVAQEAVKRGKPIPVALVLNGEVQREGAEPESPIEHTERDGVQRPDDRH